MACMLGQEQSDEEGKKDEASLEIDMGFKGDG